VKVGDLIRHKKAGVYAIVVNVRGIPRLRGVGSSYIDFVWLDDGSPDSSYSGLFEVINAV
jgi:hypothetical protein